MFNKIYRLLVFSSFFVLFILVIQVKLLLIPLIKIELSIVENMFLLLMFLFIIVTNLYIFRREKISKLLYITSFPLALFTIAYILMLIINIPTLFIKERSEIVLEKVSEEEYKKYSAINSSLEKLRNEVLSKKDIKMSDLKELKSLSESSKNTILGIQKKYGYILDYIKENKFSDKYIEGSKEKKYVILNFYNLQLIELYQINDLLNQNKNEEAIDLLKMNYNVIIKFMQMKILSDDDAVLLNNMLSKYIDFIAINISRIDIKNINFIDTEKLEKTHKNMVKKVYFYKSSKKFIKLRKAIEEISILSYPLLNKNISKNDLENKSILMISYYGVVYPKRKISLKNKKISSFLINPVWNIFLNPKINTNRSLKEFDVGYNKIKLLDYIIKFKGDYLKEKLPIDILTGKKFIITEKNNEKIIISEKDNREILKIK